MPSTSAERPPFNRRWPRIQNIFAMVCVLLAPDLIYYQGARLIDSNLHVYPEWHSPRSDTGNQAGVLLSATQFGGVEPIHAGAMQILLAGLSSAPIPVLFHYRGFPCHVYVRTLLPLMGNNFYPGNCGSRVTSREIKRQARSAVPVRPDYIRSQKCSACGVNEIFFDASFRRLFLAGSFGLIE